MNEIGQTHLINTMMPTWAISFSSRFLVARKNGEREKNKKKKRVNYSHTFIAL
jgi:hypothetical protein